MPRTALWRFRRAGFSGSSGRATLEEGSTSGDWVTALIEVLRWLSPARTWEEYQAGLVDWFVARANAEAGFLWLADDDGTLVCVAAARTSSAYRQLVGDSVGIRLGPDAGCFGEPGGPALDGVPAIAACPGYPRAASLCAEGLTSSVKVRLQWGGRMLGLVELLSGQTLGDLSEWDAEIQPLLPEVAHCLEERQWLHRKSLWSRLVREATLAGRCGAWVYDVRKQEVHLSAEWCALVGASCEPLLGTRLDWESRVHPADRSAFVERIDRALNSGASRCDFVFRLASEPDRYQRAIQQSTIERDASGIAVRITGLHIVTTDTVDADLAGPATENRDYASLLSPAGMFHADARGRCVYVNDRWCEISGLTREEAMGDGWASALHPADRERVVATWNASTAARQVFRGEYRFVDRQGCVHWVFGQALAVRTPDGDITGYVGTITDLSERRAMEAQVEERNQFYQSLVETTDTGFCVVDQQGRVLEANGNYVRLIGRNSVAEVIGRNVLEWTWPAELERNRRELAGTFERGYVRNLRMTYINRLGERVSIEINATVVHHPAGPRVVALCRDIRDRIEIETRLEQTAAQLQFLSRRLLESHENERRHLARELHDEIGQVLTAVSVSLKSLQHEAPPEVIAKLNDSVSLVDASIRQIRNMSLDLRPSMLDDLGLLPTLQWYISRFQQRTGLQVDLAVPPQLPRYSSTIETTCFRVVQESLTNVARHARATHVGVQLETSHSSVRLRIIDNGIGFNPVELLERRQALPTAGLLGMRERVQLLGGQLTVDSAVGSGTTITARFPLSEPRALVIQVPDGVP